MALTLIRNARSLENAFKHHCESPASKLESKSEPTEAEKMESLEQAILQACKLAESDLEMAQAFLQRGTVEIARRRLGKIIDEVDGAEAAIEAKTM